MSERISKDIHAVLDRGHLASARQINTGSSAATLSVLCPRACVFLLDVPVGVKTVIAFPYKLCFAFVF